MNLVLDHDVVLDYTEIAALLRFLQGAYDNEWLVKLRHVSDTNTVEFVRCREEEK